MPCITEVKPVMEKAKKKRLKKYITWISMVAVVALLAAMPLLARSEVEEDGPVASILEGTVQLASLETGLHGGGTLSAGNAMDVELPKGVKITEFLVKNGDMVSEGDPVAVVDRVSVMTAIVQVRDAMDYIRDEMADAKDEKAASTVKATAGGRVKEVYAQAGDSVQDVMLRHGALAVLSLDGMMAVELEVDTALAAGDSVTVAFSDGSEVSGRVESNLDGCLVVTVSDQNYELGEGVTVADEEGVSIGSGSLYIHNAWKATAYTGTVSAVYARENTDVYDGASLFTLKDTDFAGTLNSLASLHREYEELLQKLFTMYETEVLTAPCDGKVSGVDADSEFLLAAIAGEEGWFVDLLDNPVEEKGWTVMLLSSTETDCTESEDCKAEKHKDDCPRKCTGKETCGAEEGKHDPGCAVFCIMDPKCANLNHKTGCPGVCTGDGDTCKSERSHEHHLPSCIKRCISDLEEDGETTCDADVHYDACIENCTEDETCEALTHKKNCHKYGITYRAYAAKITLRNTDKTQVLWGTTLYEVTPEGQGWKLVNPDKIVDQFPGDKGVDYTGPELPAQCGVGDTILLVMEIDASGQTLSQKSYLYADVQEGGAAPGIPEGFPGIGDLGDLSGLFAGLGGLKGFGGIAGLYGGAAATGPELYDLEGDVLLTVTEQDTMTLSIALDEQDIAKVSLGQKAQVKINPLKDRSFEAEVTEVGLFGTGNGGSSKFTVELTVPMEADMLAGMSATAYLPLDARTDVLTVPVAALVEEGGRTLVCTALDPETGEPASPVEVTTGVSDGTAVEILSGMTLGDQYYYSYYDTLELSTEVETDKYTFG